MRGPAADQCRRGHGRLGPFFGPALHHDAGVALAQQSGAPVVPAVDRRLPRGAASPAPNRPADVLPPRDEAARPLAHQRAMEELIRRCPRQYLWGYHRYKKPPGRAAAELHAGLRAAGPAVAAALAAAGGAGGAGQLCSSVSSTPRRRRGASRRATCSCASPELGMPCSAASALRALPLAGPQRGGAAAVVPAGPAACDAWRRDVHLAERVAERS